MDGPAQGGLAVIDLHANSSGIGLGIANQRLLDLLFNLATPDRRRDLEVIVDALCADEKSHRLARRLTLELIGNLAGEREHPVVGRDRDPLVGYRGVPAPGILRCPGEVRALSHIRGWQLDIEIVHHGDDAPNPPRITLRGVLLAVAADGPAEG